LLRLLSGILLVAIVLGISPHFNPSVEALSPNIVISQIYGGGGNMDAPYKADYIELFNRGSIPVSINGWSVQYASSTGTDWLKTDLPDVTLQPGQYFLIQQSAEGTNGVSLPTPDLVKSPVISMAAGAGKVALVNNQTVLPAITCPLSPVLLPEIVDFVGYGAANCSEANSDTPAPSNTTAVFRNDESCAETDNNTADFTAAAPAPRNTATTLNSCYPDTTIDDSPTNPSSSANATFEFSSADAGSSFQCQLDNLGWEACTSPKDYAGLADGSHTFEVKATNTRGNTDPTPATHTWVIDTVPPDTDPPETTIDTHPTDPSNSADASFTFSADEPGTFECQLDGLGWAACTSPKDYTGLADGSHTFEVRATDAALNTDPTPASFTWLIDTAPPPATSILVSAQAAGTIGALSFGSEDILKWDGSAWSMWFDGSAANLNPSGKAKHNINAFWVPDPNGAEVILSLGQNRRHVTGLTSPVDGMDLVRWDGLGFYLYFDGSDVGLTSKTQEKIDALHILPGSESPINGGNCLAYLLISTQGPGKVNNYSGGRLKFGGEDVLGFCMTGSGATTTGLWHMVLDGSTENMPMNSLINLSASDDGQVLYLTTRKNFNVDAASGGQSMVYRFDRGTGLFSGPFFSAPAAGLGEKLDGLQVIGELP
jgi:hypothetical protein